MNGWVGPVHGVHLVLGRTWLLELPPPSSLSSLPCPAPPKPAPVPVHHLGDFLSLSDWVLFLPPMLPWAVTSHLFVEVFGIGGLPKGT